MLIGQASSFSPLCEKDAVSSLYKNALHEYFEEIVKKNLDLTSFTTQKVKNEIFFTAGIPGAGKYTRES
jgi:hypothetical protein